MLRAFSISRKTIEKIPLVFTKGDLLGITFGIENFFIKLTEFKLMMRELSTRKRLV